MPSSEHGQRQLVRSRARRESLLAAAGREPSPASAEAADMPVDDTRLLTRSNTGNSRGRAATPELTSGGGARLPPTIATTLSGSHATRFPFSTLGVSARTELEGFPSPTHSVLTPFGDLSENGHGAAGVKVGLKALGQSAFEPLGRVITDPSFPAPISIPLSSSKYTPPCTRIGSVQLVSAAGRLSQRGGPFDVTGILQPISKR